MTEKLDKDSLHALMVAFCYMPQSIEVTKYEYGDRTEAVLAEIEVVRGVLLDNDVDPDEVQGDLHPERTPNSSY